jgi:hypothetical protein
MPGRDGTSVLAWPGLSSGVSAVEAAHTGVTSRFRDHRNDRTGPRPTEWGATRARHIAAVDHLAAAGEGIVATWCR